VIFTYRPNDRLGPLDLNECAIAPIERMEPGTTKRGWLLVFYGRADDGHEQTYRVPVNPNGPHIENGPLGRTWSLNRCGPGEWQVSPSINLGDWHYTPKIVGVPDDEPWIAGAP
jgi:hypothetical protein